MPAFDPADAVAVVHSHPDVRVHPDLLNWLYAVGLDARRVIYVCHPRDVTCSYNTGVKRALATGAKHLIFADNDIRPQVPAAAPFLAEATADVVGAFYPCAGEDAFDRPGVIHCGLWRTTRAVLAAVPPPWFAWGYSPDGDDLVRCPCAVFSDKVRAAGFSVGRAGHVIHKPRA